MYGIGALPDDFSLYSGDDELMGSGSDPLSIRLNNPGAIAKSAFRWEGASADQPPGRFIAFDTPEDGIRAMARNLDAYGSKYGLNTVAGIVNRWAPPSENDTRQYAATVAKALGVDPNQPLNLDDPRLKAKLMTAMARVEAGRDHYTEDQIFSVIGGKGPSMQPEYDVDQGLASIDQMGQRVGQMQPGVSALPQPPQRTGLSGLNPYLQIAAQLMPERQGSGWGDALINAGAAMMQSRSPDFLGAAGAGLQAGNQALQARRGQDRQDVMDRFKFGMGLAQFDQKDAGEYAMSDGVLYNKKTGLTQQVGVGKAPPTREVKIGDRVVTQEWNGAMWKNVGEAPRSERKPGEIEEMLRLAGLDPASPEGRDMVKRILEKKGKSENEGQFPGTGIDASTFNHLVNYNQKIRSGQPTTPQEDMAYSIAYQHASRPTRWTTPDGAMYEAPGIDVSGFVPPKVATQVAPASGAAAAPSSAVPGARPIVLMAPAGSASPSSSAPSPSGSGSQPGARQIVPPDEKPVAGDSAGRFALVPEARAALDQAQRAYFPDGKTFDRTLAGVAYMNVPNSKGAEIYNAVSRAIANRLRIESGAAAPPAEVAAMTKRYLPTPWDSDTLARQKLDGLKQYFDAFATSATQGAGPAIRGGGTPDATPPQPKPQSGVGLPAPASIATMSMDAINALSPRVTEMSDDQLRAMHARRRQLIGIQPDGQIGSGGMP